MVIMARLKRARSFWGWILSSAINLSLATCCRSAWPSSCTTTALYTQHLPSTCPRPPAAGQPDPAPAQYTVLNTHHLLSTYPWPPAAGQPDPAPAQYTALICSRPAKTNPCVVERGTKTVTNAHLADIPIFLLPDSVDFFRVRKQPLKTGSRNHILKSYTGNIFIHDYQFYGKS